MSGERTVEFAGNEMTLSRVGEHVERLDGNGGPIFRCTVCGTNYSATRFVGRGDPCGIQAAESAFECHPEGEAEA